jgi:hypothetical protein
MHDVPHSNDLRSLPQFVHREKAFAEAITKSFDGDVQAYLIPKLEAVNEGFSRVIDTEWHASHGMLLDPISEGSTRESKDPKFEVRWARLPCARR